MCFCISAKSFLISEHNDIIMTIDLKSSIIFEIIDVFISLTIRLNLTMLGEIYMDKIMALLQMY